LNCDEKGLIEDDDFKITGKSDEFCYTHSVTYRFCTETKETGKKKLIIVDDSDSHSKGNRWFYTAIQKQLFCSFVD
jgi:hypothetical protein